MIIKAGTYAGDAVDDREILTGNAPDLVIVKGVNPAVAGFQAHVSIRGMGDAAKNLDSNAEAFVTGHIKSMTATGFTVGTIDEVNASGRTYYWLAIEDDSAGDFEIGTYNGNGADNRNISLASITGTPALVMVFGNTNQGGGFWRSNVHTGDHSGWFNSTSTHTTNGIQAFGAGSFQVGTRDQVNRGTGTPAYYWAAFTEVSGQLEVVTYLGDNSDNRSITGAGFDPDIALVQPIDTTGQTMAVRFPDHVGDSSALLSNVDNAANRIQSFITDGIQVGSAVNVNTVANYAAIFMKTTAGAPGGGGGAGGNLLLLGVG